MSAPTIPGELWRPLSGALDRVAADGCRVRLWLRDDDAVATTPALSTFLDLLEAAGIPALLAVIPASATSPLRAAVARRPRIAAAVHGWAHANHARPGERAQELGPQRPVRTVAAEVRRGLLRLKELFATQALPVLVPPWNRFDEALLPHLRAAGFRAVSAFGTVPASLAAHRLLRFDAHLDLIDWKRARRCRDPRWLVEELARLVAASARDGFWPIGVLTHHLVHEVAATHFLEQLFAVTAGHPGAQWLHPTALLAGGLD